MRSGSLPARGRAAALLVALLLVVSGCSGNADPEPGQSPTSSTDASQQAITAAVNPGPHPTRSVDYHLPDLEISGLKAPVEVQGHVVGPDGVTGSVPLVMILHGYTASCVKGEDTTTDWPCKKGFEPIPNALGFEYLQQRLASQGYLTVSVSGNGVNVLATDRNRADGAPERSILIRHHLDAWAAREVPGTDAWPQVDVRSVLLVGHSRGGEGVDWATHDRPDDAAWHVRGEVLLGPTDMAAPDDPAALRSEVPVLGIVGRCDGDVGPAPAQFHVDRPADPALLRTSTLVVGANHNFFNSQWDPATSSTPGAYDDAFLENGEIDSRCKPGAPERLTGPEQQEVAARLIGLAAAAFLRDQAGPADVLDGRTPVPLLGKEAVLVSAIGRGRTTLTFDGTDGTDGATFTASGHDGLKATPCNGVSETEDPKDCGGFTGEGVSVHWPDAYRDRPVRQFVHLAWSKPGGSVVLEPENPLDLSAADGLEARIAVDPKGSPIRLEGELADAQGRTVRLPEAAEIAALPAGDFIPSRRWGQQAFLPLAGTSDVDVRAIVRISLFATTESGEAWIIDVSARPRSPGA